MVTLFEAGYATAGDGANSDRPGFLQWFGGFQPTLDLRSRLEWADQKTSEKSLAWTTRARPGVLTPVFKGFQGFAEMELNDAIERDGYNAAGIHGPARKTAIADPESSELNRAWLAFRNEDIEIKAGRQRIVLDGARFIGNVGWRQNEQTYDALALKASPLEDLKLFYAWVYNVHRIFGSHSDASDFDSRSHLINAKYAAGPLANLTAYAYLLDLQRASADAGSTNTYGASIEGSKAVGKAKLGYYLEFARQDNAARSTTSYNANYYHVKGTAKIQNVTVGVAREVLGNENGFGFSTPLATLHKWDGFADKFLTTPADSIEDNYVLAAVPLPWGVKLKAFIHHFHAESGKNSYGHEYDVVLAKEFPRGIKALVKGMFYEADDNAPNFALTDTSKVALQLEYRWPPNPKKR